MRPSSFSRTARSCSCVPHGSSIPAHLLAYAAHTLSAQPHVSVYVEMGSADWFRDQPADAVRMLEQAGVADARGFALDTSHFDSVGRQVDFGQKIVAALAADGIADRHFVIDTSDSGHAFTGAWYHAHHPGPPLGYAKPCRSTGQSHCVALGIPPTTDVGAAAWGLSPAARGRGGGARRRLPVGQPPLARPPVGRVQHGARAGRGPLLAVPVSGNGSGPRGCRARTGRSGGGWARPEVFETPTF